MPTMQTVAYKRGYLHYSTVGDATSIRARNEWESPRNSVASALRSPNVDAWREVAR